MKNCFFFILFLLLISSCKEDPPIIPPPPPPEPKITLSLDDVSCTEAWLNLKLENVTLPVDLELKKDSTLIKSFLSVRSSDTTLFVDSLLPNQTYNFQLTSIQNLVSSNHLSVTTIDTTSHNFTWQTFEFGQHSSSVLYDVAIIDENNIWAVGEIYMNDSLGNPDPTYYNAIHWDGIEWKPIRILYNGSTWSIKTVFAFSSNDIWFSAFVRYLNGQFVELPIPGILMGWGVNKIWGSSSNDLYVVGNNGNIAHYNGSQWTKIERGTTLDIHDIWGDYDEKLNQWEVLAIASHNVAQGTDRTLLKIENGTSNIISTEPISRRLFSLWFKTNRKYYLVGGGVYEKTSLSDSLWTVHLLGDITSANSNCIRGTDINNVFIAGSFAEIVHFNGYSWKNYSNEIPFRSGPLSSISIKDELVLICGFSNNKAIILKGTR